MLTLNVELSRANVSIPDVLRFRKLFLAALRVMVAVDAAVRDTPPDPFTELLVLLKVLPETVSVSVPVLFRASKRFSPALVSPLTKLKVEFVTRQVPERFHNFTSPSPGASPKPVTVQPIIVRLATFWPLMPTWAPPAPPLPLIFKLAKFTPDTLLMLMPA